MKKFYLLYLLNAASIIGLGEIIWKYEHCMEKAGQFWYVYVLAGIYLLSLCILMRLKGEKDTLKSFLKVDLFSFFFISFFFLIEISYEEIGSWRRWLFILFFAFFLFKLSLWFYYIEKDGKAKRFLSFLHRYICDVIIGFLLKKRLRGVLLLSAGLFASGVISYVLWSLGRLGDRPDVAIWGNGPQPWGWHSFLPFVLPVIYLMFSGIYLFFLKSNKDEGIRLFAVDLLTYIFIPVFWVLELAWKGISDWYTLFSVFYLVVALIKSALVVEFLYHRLKRSTESFGKILFVSVFVILFSFSIWHIRAVSTTGDGPYYLLITHSIIHDHDIDLKNNFANRDYKYFYWSKDLPKAGYVYKIKGKEVIVHYSTLYPVLLIPGYLLGGRTGAVIVLLLFASFLVVNLYLLIYVATGSPFASFWTSLLVGFSSPVFFHVAQLFPEIVGASLVVWVVKEAYFFRKYGGETPLKVLGAVTLLVILALVRDRFLSVAVVLFLILMFSIRNNRYRLVMAGIVGLVALLFFAVVPHIGGGGVYRHFMYMLNSFLSHGFKVLTSSWFWKVLAWRNFLGMVFDQELGLLIYAPFYIFSFIGFVFMLKRDKVLFIYTLIPVFWEFCVLSFFKGFYWYGGWAAPLRYMMCVVPLLGVPLGYAFVNLKGYLFKVLMVIFASWSLFVSLFMTYNPYYMYGKWNGTNNLLLLLKKYVHINLARFLPSSFVLNNFLSLAYWWTLIITVILILVYITGRRYKEKEHSLLYPLSSFFVVLFLVFVFWLGGNIPFNELWASAMFHTSGVGYDDYRRHRSLWVMQGNGKIYDYVVLPKGKNRFLITAAGCRTLDRLPRMLVKVNHNTIGEVVLDCKKNNRWYEGNYRLEFSIPCKGIYLLEFVFDNLIFERKKRKISIAYVYDVRRE